MKYHDIEALFDEMIDDIIYAKISSKLCNLNSINKK